jgi:hypothetical protein
MKINFNPLNLVAFFVLIVLAGILVALARPMPVIFRANGISEVTQLLSSLILVSLFLERTIEVFITVWRGPQARLLQNTVRSHQLKLMELNKPGAAVMDREAKVAQTSADLETAKQEAVANKSITQRWALWASFALGLAISLVGVRTLNSLITPESYAALNLLQKNFFDLVDILITGGLIAGGSSGIHSILQVFIDMAEATSNRIKTPNSPAG